SAANDIIRVRENVEKWFDSTMDRVSGWYKRRVQWFTWIVGIGLAVALNADTFAVADRLTRDSALRATVVPDATPRAEKDAKAKEAKDKGQPKPDPKPDNVTQQVNEIRSYGWPLGWSADTTPASPIKTGFEVDGRALGAWALKVMGLLITAAAISLGAPFWFD